MKPSIGRIVIVQYSDNGMVRKAPAIINSVVTDTLIEATAFPPAAQPISLTGLRYCEEPNFSLNVWYWPPRVKETS